MMYKSNPGGLMNGPAKKPMQGQNPQASMGKGMAPQPMKMKAEVMPGARILAAKKKLKTFDMA